MRLKIKIATIACDRKCRVRVPHDAGDNKWFEASITQLVLALVFGLLECHRFRIKRLNFDLQLKDLRPLSSHRLLGSFLLPIQPQVHRSPEINRTPKIADDFKAAELGDIAVSVQIG